MEYVIQAIRNDQQWRWHMTTKYWYIWLAIMIFCGIIGHLLQK